MLTFAANPRDSHSMGTACHACCCEDARMQPGETLPWAINYAGWVAGIGGRGLSGQPVIAIEKQNAPVPGGTPTANTDYQFTGTLNTPITGSLATNATGGAAALTYAVAPLFMPAGTLSINPNTGAFTYTPGTGFFGYDGFWFTTSDGINAPITRQVLITVNQPSPAAALPSRAFTPVVQILPVSIETHPTWLKLPVAVSPAAMVGDVYKITLRASALDCNGTQYVHQWCASLQIGKC